jgi:hypothetical protein
MRIRLLEMTDQQVVDFILSHPVSGGKTGGGGLINQGIQTSQQDQQQENTLASDAQGTLQQFEGPVQNSPFYKAMLTSGQENTTAAYNNAKQNLAQKAKMGGFGYSNPVATGGGQLDAQEASTKAALPAQTALEASGPALQAAGQSGSMAMGYGNQGVNYYGDAARLKADKMKQDWQNAQTIYSDASNAAGGLGAALFGA